MNRTRAISSGLCLLGLVGMVISGISLGHRVGAYNEEADFPLYAFAPYNAMEFTFRNRPVVITDRADNDARYLDVDYDGQKISLFATIPSKTPLPGLRAHADWMALLRFADSSGQDFDTLKARIDSGEVQPRLVLVTRTPLPGAPEGWGETWRKDWVFDFYEFLPEGGFAHERFDYPKTRAGKKPTPGQLQPSTWQYEAALRLMPRHTPTLTFRDNAVSNPGWQLRTFAASGVLFVFAFAFAIAPRRRVQATNGQTDQVAR